MDDPRAQRTLVKSPPELWAEVSDAGALAGHLGEFGEIRITRLEPETAVAWEGERARGTVQLEPSGWGTKVTLTARLAGGPEPAATADPGPADAPEPEPGPADAPESHAEPADAPESHAEPADAPESHAEPADAPAPEAPPAKLRALLRRLFARRTLPTVSVAAPEPPADAEPADAEPAADAEPPVDAQAPAEADPPPPPHPALSDSAAPDLRPAPELQPPVTAEPAPLDAGRAEQILVGVLDDLGAARHRPFSRG